MASFILVGASIITGLVDYAEKRYQRKLDKLYGRLDRKRQPSPFDDKPSIYQTVDPNFLRQKFTPQGRSIPLSIVAQGDGMDGTAGRRSASRTATRHLHNRAQRRDTFRRSETRAHPIALDQVSSQEVMDPSVTAEIADIPPPANDQIVTIGGNLPEAQHPPAYARSMVVGSYRT